MQGTDGELLDRWRAGDTAAGESLFQRHIGVLSRFFRNKVEAVEREDLIQSTFLACVEARDRLRPDGRFRPYMLRVARSKLYDHFARGETGITPVAYETSVADLCASPSAAIARDQQDERLFDALRQLPLELQALVELHYWDQVTTAELAEIFALPQGTIKTRLLRARKRLAKLLESAACVGEATIDGERLAEWIAALDVGHLPLA